MKTILFSLTLLLAFPSARAAPKTTAEEALEPLAFLAGHWRGEKDGVVTEEVWLPPAGGMCLGMNRSVAREGGRASFEFLRIEVRDGKPVYLASPSAEEPTPFVLTSSEEGAVAFANPEHDFPQRIEYRLDPAQKLAVRVWGEHAGEIRAEEWLWEKVAP
jgi:hypothetical protein